MLSYSFMLSCYLSIVIIVLQRQRIQLIPIQKQIISMISFCYVLTVIAVTILPLRIGLRQPLGVQNYFIPLQDIMKMYYSKGIYSMNFWKNIVVNIILFMPIGVIVPLTRKVGFLYILVFGLCVSLIIEMLQLFMQLCLINYRVVSVDDVILNTIGAIIGYILFKISINHCSIIQKTIITISHLDHRTP